MTVGKESFFQEEERREKARERAKIGESNINESG